MSKAERSNSNPYFLSQSQLMVALAAAIVAIWALVGWQYRQGETDAVRGTETQTSDLALAFAEHTAGAFRDVDYVLKELRDYSSGPRDKLLHEVIQHQQLLIGISHQISILDAQGRLQFSSNDPTPQPIDLSDREHFTVHRDSGGDRLFVSRPVKGRLSGKWSIQLTRPIRDGERFLGVIVISVAPESLVQFHEKIHLGKQAIVAIIRDSGDVMARNIDMEHHIGKVIDTTPFGMPGAPSHGTFRATSQVDGIERIIGYVRLGEYGLTVIVGAATAESMAPIRSRNHWLINVTGALTLALAALAWLARHRTRMWRELHAQRERERKVMEELNRDFVALLENTSDFVYFKDQDSRFRFCSQTLADAACHVDP